MLWVGLWYVIVAYPGHFVSPSPVRVGRHIILPVHIYKSVNQSVCLTICQKCIFLVNATSTIWVEYFLTFAGVFIKVSRCALGLDVNLRYSFDTFYTE